MLILKYLPEGHKPDKALSKDKSVLGHRFHIFLHLASASVASATLALLL